MNEYTWRILFVFIPSLLSLLYGLLRIFPKAKGLYFRASTMGIACLFMMNLSYLSLLITGHSFDTELNIGLLGGIGTAMFFHSQNLGPVATFFDDPTLSKPRNRYMPLVAPILIGLIYVCTELYWFCSVEAVTVSYLIGMVAVFGIISVLNARTAFITLRFTLIPDDSKGMVSCMRPYNIALTVFLLLTTVEKLVRYTQAESTVGFVLTLLFYCVYAANILLLLPLQERGRVSFLTSL